MKKYQKVLMVILVIGLLFSGFCEWQVRNRQKHQLEETQTKLEKAQTKLVQIEDRFKDYKIQTGEKLEGLQKELNSVQDELATLQNTTTQLRIAETKLETQEIHYEQKLIEEFERGRLEGYETALTREVSLRNPTYEELKDFLARDKTNFNAYIPNKYVCIDFAADLNNNAETAGIRAGWVLLVFKNADGPGKFIHGINVFQTTDKGLIFVEPQTDTEINLEIGDYYFGYKIKEIIIIW